MQANILRYCFKIQANIYKLWQLPKNKPSYQYRIMYNNTQKCVRHSRSIKIIQNSAIHCFLCNCGIIRTFYSLCQTRKYQTRNAELLEIWRDNQSGGTIRERERETERERRYQRECGDRIISFEIFCVNKTPLKGKRHLRPLK